MKEDFIAGHLAWIKREKTFQPQYVSDDGNSYYDIMKEIYTNKFASHEQLQRYADFTWLEDKRWLKASYALNKAQDKKLELLEPTPNGMWFVTIGFNHQTWTINACCKAIEKIIAMEWIISAKANFELFRENGEHPHCHFIIETKEPKSRILDKLFRPQYVKNLVLSKSFIDVKPMMDYHLKYIELDKQTGKQEFVNKDKDWRLANNIPDYQKNWIL